MKKLLISFLVATISYSSIADNNLWNKIEKQEKSLFKVEKGQFYQLDFQNIKKTLDQAPWENISDGFKSEFSIKIPLADGTFEEFYIERTKLMEDGLMAKYPEIRTFRGYSKKTNLRRITLDYTYKGFHAMITYPGDAIFIDPINLDTKTEYIVYTKSNFYQSNTSDFVEYGVDHTDHDEIDLGKTNPLQRPIGGELLTYRLAMATTGEYSNFHGGTAAGVLSAVQTSVARVNEVYEVDLGVRLILIANTDLLFQYNSATDPYSNSNGGAMLGQNQGEVDNVIGSANYDIGHVFSTGGGGIASYASVCDNNRKAQGVTGSFSPINDPFDIDYVAHEIGHQFSGSHTFDGLSGSCGGGNRSAGTAFEPGSGSTVMAYAGICGGDNIQNNSDPYFHVGSFVEMTNFIYNGNGYTCAVSTPTSNNAPVVNANPTNSIYRIPMETPFELVGEATDPDGDDLTYTWEQYDNTSSGTGVNNPTNQNPIFRSWNPTAEGFHRVFPRIQNLVANNTVTGETLPFGTRNMEFRLTARDNLSGGGGVDYDNINVNATANSGPFRVLYPNSNLNWLSNTYMLVEWDIANTNSSPVNCNNVDIFLSTDGGFTYPDTLLVNTPNDGKAVVLLPNVTTNQARIKVKGSNNIFFDISNTNFSIQNGTQNNYSALLEEDTIYVCAPDDIEIPFYYSNLGTFNETLTLSVNGIPTGGTQTLSKTNITPNDTAILTITNTGSISSGVYTVGLTSTGNNTSQTHDVVLVINNGAPDAPDLVYPASNNFGGETNPIFSWKADGRAISYEIDISEQSDFSSFFWREAGITDTFFVLRKYLDENTEYFWRIKTIGACEDGVEGTGNSFSTTSPICQTFSLDSIIPITQGENTVTFNVIGNGTVSDININNLNGTHANTGDIKISLISPDNSEILLIDRACNFERDFNIRFDDQSTRTEIPCPYTTGLTYQAVENIYSLKGTQINGNWTLKIQDFLAPFNGELENFEFEICTVDGSVDLVESANEFINIYPNPATDKLFINSNKDINSVSISNVIGQRINDYKGTINQIDISDLSEGIYFITVSFDKGSPITKRVLVK